MVTEEQKTKLENTLWRTEEELTALDEDAFDQVAGEVVELREAWLGGIKLKTSDYKKYVKGIDKKGNSTVDFNVLLPMPKSYELKLSEAETMAKIKALLPKDPKWRHGGYNIEEILGSETKED